MYPRIKPARMGGHERLKTGGKDLPATVLQFWQWASSDLLGNTLRGIFAEFLVGYALGLVDDGTANDWERYDLLTKDDIRVEVKASAYIQSWHQEKLSTPRFSIRKAEGWDPDTDTWSPAARNSDVYVFCLLHHKEQATIDPLNLDQWTFYVISTEKLNVLGEQKSVGLGTLRSLAAIECRWDGLAHAVSKA